MYAKYTVVLKDLLDSEQTKPLIDKALSTYPLYVKRSKEEFIPAYIPTREELNRKLLNFYKYREIGFETVGRFLDELETAMNEIMPRYNLLYLTADQDFNVIWNVDYKKEINTDRTGENTGTTSGTHTGNVSGSTESEINATGKTTGETSGTDTTNSTLNSNHTNKKVHADTPQDLLNIPAANIDGVGYADSVEWNKDTNNDTTNTTSNTSATTESDTTQNTTSSGSNTTETTETTTGSSNTTTVGNEKTVETTKGNFGVVSAQDLVLKYRETILNIDQMIINDPRIKELFMLVY